MSIAIPAKVSWLSSRHSMRSPKSPDSEFTETDVEEVRFRIKHTENDVMVSYCRRNTPFVKDLVKYLNSLGIDPWVDWEDIRPAVDWMKAIRHGIVDAYAFICVLSPEYLESKICLEELDIALKSGKLIVPVVCKDIDWSSPKLPKELAKINFIFIRETDDPDEGLQKVNEALHTDQEYVHYSAELSRRSVHYEDEKNPDIRKNMLVTGELLELYERVIINGVSKDPRPTLAMTRFVKACRLQSKKANRERQRYTRIAYIAIAVAFLVLLVGVLVSVSYSVEADKARADAEKANAELETTNQQLQGTIDWFYCSFYFFSSQCYANTTSVFPGRSTVYVYNYRNQTYDAVYEDLAGKPPPNLDCPAILVDRYKNPDFSKPFASARYFKQSNLRINRANLYTFFNNTCGLGDT